MAATAVGFSLLAGNPVYAAEKSAENFGYEEELRSLFDSEWYASQYPDVVKVYGTDEDALFKHFMTFEINEGRGINTYFDAESYKEANPDQLDNPGEPIDPYEPNNPVEPVKPEQPKLCYPTKVIIDINGTITVNIVSEIEASIDFDGHFGIKFKT